MIILPCLLLQAMCLLLLRLDVIVNATDGPAAVIVGILGVQIWVASFAAEMRKSARRVYGYNPQECSDQSLGYCCPCFVLGQLAVDLEIERPFSTHDRIAVDINGNKIAKFPER